MSRAPIDLALDRIPWTELPTQVERDGIPWATHEGVIQLGPFALKCYQLSNGQRVFDADDIARIFGGETIETPDSGAPEGGAP